MQTKTTQRALITTLGLALAGVLTACNNTPGGGGDMPWPDGDMATAGQDMTSTGGDMAKPLFSFFITSRMGSGNLGGLTGADTTCKNLAMAAGGGARTWAAYLSATGVNARDRIGQGPWYNKAGTKIADNVTDLHQQVATVGITGTTGTDENGVVVPTNQHDIITGSNAQGMLVTGQTCVDWTSAMDGGVNVTAVGHYNRAGGGAAPTSWNAAHVSRGCSAAELIASAGAGRFYCFATD